jgi:hypothetical protein
LPREIRRVNYGESISEIVAEVVNDTDSAGVFRLRLYVHRGDTMITELFEEDLSVPPQSRSSVIGPLSLLVDEEGYVPGEYHLRARLLVIDSPNYDKGHELHKIAHRFWVEEDPPERGIFENVEGLDYGEPSKIDGEAVPTDSGSYIFQYNVSHPGKRRWDTSENELFDYLFRMMARELVYVDLRSDEPTQFRDDDLELPERVAKRSAEIIGQIMYEFYG